MTCSLAPCPHTAGAQTVPKAQRTAAAQNLLLGRAALRFQGQQLAPGSQVQMVGVSGTIYFESEVGGRFPREKGQFEPRTTGGQLPSCCWSPAVGLILPPREDRGTACGSTKRTFPSDFTTSRSTSAHVEENCKPFS